MEKHIKERWDDKKLAEIASRYGTTSDAITMLDGFESFIYEYERDGKGYILRISHSNRRSSNLIHAEVDWLNYLARGGARVAQAIASDAGNLVEALDDGHGEQFLATAFVKAVGDHLSFATWTSEFMQHYGETIGRIHRLSREYTPSNPNWQRTHWDDKANHNLDEWETWTEPQIIAKVRPVFKRLQALPHDESYHMIHQDAHGGNFYVDDNGHITLFDFDDCCYGHAIYDIAMVIFYVPQRYHPEKTGSFTTNFLTGYLRETTLDPKWLAAISDFLKLREVDLYALIERDVDWRNGEDQWAMNFMQGRRERILNDEPTIDFDFTSLSYLFH